MEREDPGIHLGRVLLRLHNDSDPWRNNSREVRRQTTAAVWNLLDGRADYSDANLYSRRRLRRHIRHSTARRHRRGLIIMQFAE